MNIFKIFTKKKDTQKTIQSKCPFNDSINCISGAFCDGCSHEFDDIKNIK